MTYRLILTFQFDNLDCAISCKTNYKQETKFKSSVSTKRMEFKINTPIKYSLGSDDSTDEFLHLAKN